MDAADFFVVVPYFNEASGIEATLNALAGQSDRRFSLVLVDNGSTDGGEQIARGFAARQPELQVYLVHEAQKGTGAAADTGFRYAIGRGARWIARTDADCLPRADWICNLKRAFREQRLELVAGKIKPRGDDVKLTRRDRLLLPLVLLLAENFGKLHRRGRQFKYPYILVAGNNMAITAGMYLRAGGFPRSRIEDEHEDRTLSERVRTLTRQAAVRNDVVVYNSIRRARRYGYRNALLWYWDHRYKPAEVDVRWTKAERALAPREQVSGCEPVPLAFPTLPRLQPRSQARMRYHELRVYLASHPLALVLAELVRPLGPVVRLPVVGTVVNDPRIAAAVLRDPRFTKSGPGSAGAVITQVMGGSALLNMDGDAHRALRGRLTELFAPEYLDRWIEPLLTDELAKLRLALAGTEGGAVRRTVDLVDVMHRLTGRLTCHMLGVSPAPGREDELYRQIFDLGSRLIGVMQLTTLRLPAGRLAQARSYCAELTELARPAYQDSSTRSSALIHRLRDAGLSFEEARGILAVMFLVGTETVSTAVPRIVALLLDSGGFATLRRQRDLLPSAIDEALRFVVPSPIMLRSPSEEARVDRQRFGANRRVLLFTYNLLKDPRFTPQPRRFMIERRQHPGVKNLWFGAGPHFCLGYALAHREIRAVIETLLDVPGDLEVVDRRYARHVMLPAYASLRLRVRS